MTLDLDIESALVHGQLAAGISPARLAVRMEPRLVIVASHAFRPGGRAPDWTRAEDAFLRQALGWLSEDEIARRLGRTPVAVHLRWKRDLHLSAPSKAPEVLTANQIAEGMGMDLHAVGYWIDSGLLPGRRLPTQDVTRIVARAVFLRWLVNPEHWMYFDPNRVGGEAATARAGVIFDFGFWQHARRLLDLARARWNDEWWSARQIADYHGVTTKDVQRYIRLGRLPAMQIVNLSGRHATPHWSLWFARRSDAEQLVFQFGAGSGHAKDWSRAADAFLILALAVGLSTNAIGRMGFYGGAKDVYYRWSLLQRKRLISETICAFDLPVCYFPRRQIVFADWREVPDRFPRLTRALRRFKAGDDLARPREGGVLAVHVAPVEMLELVERVEHHPEEVPVLRVEQMVHLLGLHALQIEGVAPERLQVAAPERF